MTNATTRRSFLQGSAALLAALGWEGCITKPCCGATLPKWKPGELDLHFIYTGCGENIFYRLPDGTAIVNDVGEFYRPESLGDVPLLPNSSRIGGDWVCRYLKRIYDEKTIDYAIFSHFHSDHIGHANFDTPITPNANFRYRTTPDGRKIDGFLCVAEEFRFNHLMDNQYPIRGQYYEGESCVKMLESWAAKEQLRGLKVEEVKVGAMNQIALQRDPERYQGLFTIRNITANGRVWDGADGAVDYAAEHVKVTGRKKINQNDLSFTFLMRYGKFTYFATGDFSSKKFQRADGSVVDVEEKVGELVGPVTLCKMGHHGFRDAMGDSLVRQIHADAYVSAMWCPRQSDYGALTRMAKYNSAYGRQPLILPQLMGPDQRRWFKDAGWQPPHNSAVHVVVKVAPLGESYRVFLLDPSDEEMRIVAEFERAC